MQYIIYFKYQRQQWSTHTCLYSVGVLLQSQGLNLEVTSEFGPIDIIKGGQVDSDTMTSPTGLQKSHMESLNFSAFTILWEGGVRIRIRSGYDYEDAASLAEDFANP